jgi:putative SOS response-associated peptidase YedK
MCGRLDQYARIPSFRVAGLALEIKRHLAKAREDKRSRIYILNNICPTDYADVVIQDEDGLAVERMRFGLIPNWARGSKAEVSKKFTRTFNARSDSIFELGSYRQAIRKRRCIVPARGWHEWPDRTTPYYIHRSDDQPLWLAGIWDVWESNAADDQEEPLITSMSVVTTPPGTYMSKFHDRSPLVLEGDAITNWLKPDLPESDLRALLEPYECPHLEAYRVSTSANSAKNKTEEVLHPISAPVPWGDAPPEEPPENEYLKLF